MGYFVALIVFIVFGLEGQSGWNTMVIENIVAGCQDKVYARFHAQGRMLPDGLNYIDSWLKKDGMRCFQLMETDDFDLFKQWTDKWCDFTDFEIIELGIKPGHN